MTEAAAKSATELEGPIAALKVQCINTVKALAFCSEHHFASLSSNSEMRKDLRTVS